MREEKRGGGRERMFRGNWVKGLDLEEEIIRNNSVWYVILYIFVFVFVFLLFGAKKLQEKKITFFFFLSDLDFIFQFKWWHGSFKNNNKC